MSKMYSLVRSLKPSQAASSVRISSAVKVSTFRGAP
jgi:hypothetical protein